MVNWFAASVSSPLVIFPEFIYFIYFIYYYYYYYYYYFIIKEIHLVKKTNILARACT